MAKKAKYTERFMMRLAKPTKKNLAKKAKKTGVHVAVMGRIIIEQAVDIEAPTK